MKEDHVAKAYWINTFRAVHDPVKLAAYAELAGDVMEQFGGRFLARGLPARVFESAPMERTTLIEFESVQQAIDAYESREYQAALAVLDRGAERDIRIIEAIS
jgi:uncharacterized protein (DUF1330 family)